MGSVPVRMVNIFDRLWDLNGSNLAKAVGSYVVCQQTLWSTLWKTRIYLKIKTARQTFCLTKNSGDLNGIVRLSLRQQSGDVNNKKSESISEEWRKHSNMILQSQQFQLGNMEFNIFQCISVTNQIAMLAVIYTTSMGSIQPLQPRRFKRHPPKE